MMVLVVLPGLDGTATQHSAFADAMRTTFDSITVIPYPSDQILDYIALERLVRSNLPSINPFVLLGESFSGPIAISIAANPPPNLVGVVFSTTFAESPVPLLKPFASCMRFAPVRALPMPLLSWWLFGRWATSKLENELQNALLSVTPEVLRSRAVAALQVNLLAKCRAVSLPAICLQATDDRLLSKHAGKKIVEAIQHCTAIDIAGPHLLLQAVPQACAHAISEFSLKLKI